MAAAKRYREWMPDQQYLFPPSAREWLPEGHLAFFVMDVVDSFDLGAIERKIQAKDSRGTRPYHPAMMVSLLVYGYCVGVFSSRKLEMGTYEDLAIRAIAGEQHPDHSVIADFRRRHLKAFKNMFLETVRLSQRAGLVKLGRVALDGTKVQANASKHKAMSYDRMLKAEAELEVEIDRMLKLAEATDREEDARYGKRRRGDELPDELVRREDRLRKIREAKAALEAEAAEAKARELKERAERQERHAEETDDPVERKRATTRAEKLKRRAGELSSNGDDEEQPPESPADDLPRHRVPATKDGKPKPKAQRNFTDPDSRIMERSGEYLQGYNCQAAVDEANQVIVACAVTNQPPDQQHLPAMVARTEHACGKPPDQLLADAGYWDEGHIELCHERGIDPFIAPDRQLHSESLPPPRGRPPKDLDAKARMRRKLRTKKGRETYARRKVIVEPVFGQIKEARGFRRFLLRGLEEVEAEWAFICAAHNIMKLYRAGAGVTA